MTLLGHRGNRGRSVHGSATPRKARPHHPQTQPSTMTSPHVAHSNSSKQHHPTNARRPPRPSPSPPDPPAAASPANARSVPTTCPSRVHLLFDIEGPARPRKRLEGKGGKTKQEPPPPKRFLLASKSVADCCRLGPLASSSRRRFSSRRRWSSSSRRRIS